MLGQQIEISALACIRLIIEANDSRSGAMTLRKLDALNVELEVLLGIHVVRVYSTKASIDNSGLICYDEYIPMRAIQTE